MTCWPTDLNFFLYYTFFICLYLWPTVASLTQQHMARHFRSHDLCPLVHTHRQTSLLCYIKLTTRKTTVWKLDRTSFRTLAHINGNYHDIRTTKTLTVSMPDGSLVNYQPTHLCPRSNNKLSWDSKTAVETKPTNVILRM